LVTVTQYEAGGEHLIVPQRVEPGRSNGVVSMKKEGGAALTTSGAEDFIASIESAPASEQPTLDKLAAWAVALAEKGLARLVTTTGLTGRKQLKPWLPGEEAGLATIFRSETGKATLNLWRSVFERRAPEAVAVIESLLEGELGNGKTVPTARVTDKLLAALTDAYRSAAGQAHPQ
jgi:hypothetical protein